jgi:hypothetical protein
MGRTGGLEGVVGGKVSRICNGIFPAAGVSSARSHPAMTATPSSPVAVAPANSSDKALIILSHLSAIIGVGLILPFIVWLVKKNESDLVSAHAVEALNFHLSLLIYVICAIPLCAVLIGIPVLIALGIGSVVLAIIAAVKASDGGFYRYPLTIRMVK